MCIMYIMYMVPGTSTRQETEKESAVGPASGVKVDEPPITPHPTQALEAGQDEIKGMLEIIANAKEDRDHQSASLHQRVQRTPVQESWSLLKMAAGHEDNREHIATYVIFIIHTALSSQ